MRVILGIDVGGSATKIVGLDENGRTLSMLRIRAEDPVSSLYGALGSYLNAARLCLADVRRVVLTGVGSSFVEGDIFSLPTSRIDEFSACAAGALSLSGQRAALVVSMGTGTAFLRAEQGGIVEHLCGSGVGGGTLGGLCRKLVDTDSFRQIQKLARQGDLSRVDLTIRDIVRNPAATLDPSLTAANFGSLAEDASPGDLAAGVVNLVLQAIGTMTVLAARCCDTKTVVLTGSVTALSQAKANFENFEKLYGLRYIIPENAAFATAIGAALCSLAEPAKGAKTQSPPFQGGQVGYPP